MLDAIDVSTSSPAELLALGRRHLAVRDYTAATHTLSYACEMLAEKYGDAADQCAEAHLWYGKALLGLAREESGVLGDKIPDSGHDAEEDEDQEEDEEEENNEATAEHDSEASQAVEKSEAVSSTRDNQPVPSSTTDQSDEQPGTSNGDVNDESMVNSDGEEDVDNLQLAWEHLDLSRSILMRRAESGCAAVRGLLADVHLALGEVALESETYDKAVVDMLSCLELQKEIYASDDRRIAETHYQIALANSLASNFEEAVTHFKNAANILETRIKNLETPKCAPEDKMTTRTDVEAEIEELKELLPEIRAKIQDMMDYKTEIIKKVLYPSNGEGSSSKSNAAGSSSSVSQQPAQDISHLIKRKRKASETEESAPKRVNS